MWQGGELDWDKVKVKFEYTDAEQAIKVDNLGKPLVHQGKNSSFVDYSESKKGGMRLWDLAGPDELRLAESYLPPEKEYTASALGFGGAKNITRKVFYIEGVTAGGMGMSKAITITVEVTVDGSAGAITDQVNITVAEPDLGVNNSNASDKLSPGIADVKFDIDENDELLEDQGKGFVGWWNEDDVVLNRSNIINLFSNSNNYS